MPTVVGSITDSDKLASAMGMLVTGWAGGYLMVSGTLIIYRFQSLLYIQGAPIAGYLLEAFGGENSGTKPYRPAMYYAGSLTCASLGLLLFVRFNTTKKLMQKV